MGSLIKRAFFAFFPKADMCGATRDVRFGPIADIPPFTRLLRRRGRAASAHGEAERLGGLEINDKLKLIRCLYWQAGGYLAL